MLKNIGTLILVGSLFTIGCGDESERPEIVNKLRGLGVQATPEIITPSTAATPLMTTLLVTVMLPLDQTISVENYSDSAVQSVYVIKDLTIDQTSISYRPLGAFHLAEFKASFLNPSQEVLQLAGGEVARIRYGFKVIAGDEVENIVGDVLMLPEAKKLELAWQAPSISIESPSADSTIPNQETDLRAVVVNPNSEPVKLGWYVSSGKITNRRASITKWNDMSSGKQTVIATIHGKRSRTFSYSIQNLNVE